MIEETLKMQLSSYLRANNQRYLDGQKGDNNVFYVTTFLELKLMAS